MNTPFSIAALDELDRELIADVTRRTLRACNQIEQAIAELVAIDEEVGTDSTEMIDALADVAKQAKTSKETLLEMIWTYAVEEATTNKEETK